MKTDKVLCALIPQLESQDIEEYDLWMDLEDYSFRTKQFYYKIIPLINHPHSDIENGQREVHYHADTRYNGEQPNLGRHKIDIVNTRPIKGRYETRYFDLVRTVEVYGRTTPINLISKSKLKHKCIHKGKCPHRGFDLTDIEPVNGVITCPLHSLRFDAKSKELIE